jgi:ribonuclease Z
MASDDVFSLRTTHFTLEGRSRAGHETWFRIRDLDLALDVGRGPDAVVSMEHAFISHAHLDHFTGLPFYAGQRLLQGLSGGTAYVPAEAAEDVRALLAMHAKLSGTRFETEIVGMDEGDSVQIHRNHVVRAWRAAHRVAARGYEVIERRHHLLSDFIGVEPNELAALRRGGTQLEETTEHSLLFYTGDTDRGILETCPALFKSEVLLIECSFLADGHQDRAAKYRHIHIDDIADFAGKFENELIVLTHFSRRYSREQIRDHARKRLPHAIRERVRLALPDPFQIL